MKKRKVYFMSFSSDYKGEVAVVTDYSIKNIDSKDIVKGVGIESLFSYITKLPKQSKIYIENLGFNGRFLSEYINSLGYEYTNENINKLKGKYFNCLISTTGSWFNINIKTGDVLIKIVDSSKKIPLKTEEVAEAYEVEFSEDKNDSEVNIWSEAISTHMDMGMISSTISSDALNEFKGSFGRDRFNGFFPKLDRRTDEAIRRSYFGAFNYIKEEGIETGRGYSIDVKSMYPYIMKNFALPCGYPMIFEGDKIKNFDPNTHAQFFELIVHAKVKDGHLATVNNNIGVQDDYRYMDEINGELLSLTYYDLDLLYKHYEIESLQITKQYVFKASNDIFEDYVNKFYEMKSKAEAEGNSSLRQISKLMLNSLYGKFGQLLSGISNVPNGDNYVRSRISSESTIYVPIASYISSIGRWLITNAAQLNYDNLIYSDTDSLHLKGDINDLVKGEFITLGNELGCYEVEHVFTRAKHLKIKVYYLDSNIKPKITIAGLSSERKSDIDYEGFHIGMSIENGSYRSRRVEGGSIMESLPFTVN